MKAIIKLGGKIEKQGYQKIIRDIIGSIERKDNINSLQILLKQNAESEPYNNWLMAKFEEVYQWNLQHKQVRELNFSSILKEIMKMNEHEFFGTFYTAKQ
ncbi:MAG: hypothetical protein ACTSXG_03640 [Alphaproteobacteria bacterium]